MRMEVLRRGVRIIPDSELDIAYIEEILGMQNDGDSVLLKRKNAYKLNCIAYLETERQNNISTNIPDGGNYPKVIPQKDFSTCESKIVPHTILEGSREHVKFYDTNGIHCSEPNCEVNYTGEKK